MSENALDQEKLPISHYQWPFWKTIYQTLFPNCTTLAPKIPSKLKTKSSFCIWLTSFSGSGKRAIANKLDTKLYMSSFYTVIIDGDNVRNGLCKDLGFSCEDRAENIRRVADAARIMQHAA